MKSLETADTKTIKPQIETIGLKMTEIIDKYEKTNNNSPAVSNLLYDIIEEYERADLIDYNLMNKKSTVYS
jgi:hypothetical protein